MKIAKKEEAIEILERTPNLLEAFLSGLSQDWLSVNEGEGTWNVPEIVGHMAEAEQFNWIPRLGTIVNRGESEPFPAFDRFSHAVNRKDQSLKQRLADFRTLRMQSIDRLNQLITSERHLELTGRHPEFGVVTARELLSTWVVHDFTHIAQIVRVMAKRYKEDVGPWAAYLSILKR